MRTRKFLGKGQYECLLLISKWSKKCGFCTRRHILHERFGVPLEIDPKRRVTIPAARDVGTSVILKTLLGFGLVEKVSLGVYRIKPLGEQYIAGFAAYEESKATSKTVAKPQETKK